MVDRNVPPAQLYLQTSLTALAPAFDVEAIKPESLPGRGQLSQNEWDSPAVVSADKCVSLWFDLPAGNWAIVTTHQESMNQLCCLQITGSYRPAGNFTLEHPAAQV